ncbi:uncharacterized protein LOC117929619 isoform X1 [Vitis riparia]|uniref:uncharacterized protein LOC117929619 isoform X1 n=1 Tax=Vitis riparia TaxID=96939 RepID=UPI00155B01F2|nr:uncharacterized protein LOC117929619 isoform X1 [Vitis riparia]
MAGIWCSSTVSSTLHLRKRVHGIRCCSTTPDNKEKTPQLLRLAVGGVTELLRLVSFGQNRLDSMSYKQGDELLVSSIDDVLLILKSDYENAYFVTGIFTSAIYDEDCIFEDPTIKFRGKDLYSCNLKLLVPFFDHPSIALQKIEKGSNSETKFVLASWKLRTYLKLPWRPLISIAGSTVYDLNDEFKIVRHAESWNISALQAVGQIFTPSLRRLSE